MCGGMIVPDRLLILDPLGCGYDPVWSGGGTQPCASHSASFGTPQAATEMGSTNVRVGSTIFGARDYSK